jgi:hypothetical protein
MVHSIATLVVASTPLVWGSYTSCSGGGARTRGGQEKEVDQDLYPLTCGDGQPALVYVETPSLL